MERNRGWALGYLLSIFPALTSTVVGTKYLIGDNERLGVSTKEVPISVNNQFSV